VPSPSEPHTRMTSLHLCVFACSTRLLRPTTYQIFKPADLVTWSHSMHTCLNKCTGDKTHKPDFPSGLIVPVG